MSPKRKATAHDADVARKFREADPDDSGMRRAFVLHAQTAALAELVEWSVKAHQGAKLTGVKRGREAANLEHIRAYLRDLPEQHPNVTAPVLARIRRDALAACAHARVSPIYRRRGPRRPGRTA